MPELLLLEGDDLPELMARVRDELGPRATIVRAERVRSGGIAGFFSREHYELTVEVPDPRAPRQAPAAPADPFEAAMDAADRAEAGVPRGEYDEVSTAGPRFAAVLERARAVAGSPAAGAAEPRGAEPRPAAGPRRAPSPDEEPARASLAGSSIPGSALAAAVGSTVAPVAAPAGAAAATPTWGQAALALLSSGVPAALLDGARSVAGVLDRIPEPPAPPRRPGQVLALVGEPDAVADVAALLRHRWRLPAEAVLTAGAGALTSSSAVVRWRIRSSEADHPWLLVVGTPGDNEGRLLATGMVAAAQPDQVWAVVDARTKPEFVARWLEQVGTARRVDALAVEGLLETSDPGTVLGLGVPVVWADGVPATRVLWAAVLGQGLDQAVVRRR